MKIAKILKEFPIFFFTFFLLNPFFISTLRGEYIFAFKYFFQITTGTYVIPCDLYIVLCIAFAMMAITSLKMPIGVKFSIKTLWYFLLIFTFVVRKFLLYEFGMDYSPAVFCLISETNTTESSGFLNTFVFSSIGLRYIAMFCVLPFVIFIVERYWSKLIKRTNLQVKGIYVYCLGGFACIMLVLNIIHINSLNGYSGQNSLTGIYFAYLHFQKDKVSSHQFLTNMYSYNNEKAITKNKDSLNIVFVVGESFIKSHAQIYGYSLPTTPYLEKEKMAGNLFAFKDCISLFNKTTPSLQNAFSLNVLNGGGKWYESCYWPLLIKKSGYNVYMWDNQKEDDKHFQGSFHEMYAPSVCKLCYTKTNSTSSPWDEFIVKDFEKENKKMSARNFVCFHLQGQHVPFETRCPSNRTKFTPKDYHRHESWITKETLKSISDYDNAVLYNDYVLHLIYNLFKSSYSIVVFVSDHGEEVYDYRNKEGRAAMDEKDKSHFAHSQYDVPFVVWVSDKVKLQNPQLCMKLANSTEKAFSLDRIGHFIIGLAEIDTKHYSPEDDILSKEFKEKDRFIHLPGQDRVLNYEKIK